MRFFAYSQTSEEFKFSRLNLVNYLFRRSNLRVKEMVIPCYQLSTSAFPALLIKPFINKLFGIGKFVCFERR